MADKTNYLVSLFFFVSSDYFLRFLSLRDFAFETVLTAHVVVHQLSLKQICFRFFLLRRAYLLSTYSSAKSYFEKYLFAIFYNK